MLHKEVCKLSPKIYGLKQTLGVGLRNTNYIVTSFCFKYLTMYPSIIINHITQEYIFLYDVLLIARFFYFLF